MKFIINFITDSTINNINVKNVFLFLLQYIYIWDHYTILSTQCIKNLLIIINKYIQQTQTITSCSLQIRIRNIYIFDVMLYHQVSALKNTRMCVTYGLENILKYALYYTNINKKIKHN